MDRKNERQRSDETTNRERDRDMQANQNDGADERLHDLLCRDHFGEELTATDRAELARGLEESATLREAKAQLEATAALVKGTLGGGEAIGLAPERREALLTAARDAGSPGPSPASTHLRPVPLYREVALPLAACFLGVAGLMAFGMSGDDAPAYEDRTEVATADPVDGYATGGLSSAGRDDRLADDKATKTRGEVDARLARVSSEFAPMDSPGTLDEARREANELGAQLERARTELKGGLGVEERLAQKRIDEVAKVQDSLALGLGGGGAAPGPGGANRAPSGSDQFFLGRGAAPAGGAAPASEAVYVTRSGALPGVSVLDLNGISASSRAGNFSTPGGGGAGGAVRLNAPLETAMAKRQSVAGQPDAPGAAAPAPNPARKRAAAPGAPAPRPEAVLRYEMAPHKEASTRTAGQPEAENRGGSLGGAYTGPGDSVPPAPSGGFFHDDAGDSHRTGESAHELGDKGSGVTSFGVQLVDTDGDGIFDTRRQVPLHHGTTRALHCDPHRLPDERPRDMFFRFWGDNPFVITDSDALSTFAADVDTASFALASRLLRDGYVPPRAQVRTEEFVNFAKPDLAAPEDGTFRVETEMSRSPFFTGPGDSQGRYLLRVGVRAKDVAREERPPLALTFVVDVSGSMKENNRLELVKHAMRLLVGQLDARDTIAIVKFSNEAQPVLRATPANRTDLIETALFGLQPGGGTNADAGVTLGYQLSVEDPVSAEAQRRVVFLSDGVANIGQTDQTAIAERVTRFAGEGVFLNTIGVGLANHNDVFMEQLANKGQGVCDYVADAQDARRAIVDRFTGGFVTVAQDVKVQVEFDPANVLRWRQLGYENRAVADADFRNDRIDAGEIGAGHQVTCLYEVELASPGETTLELPIGTARVRFKPVDGKSVGEAVEIETPVAGNVASGFAKASVGFRRAAIAAELAEVLRASVHTAGGSMKELGRECAALLADAMEEDTARLAEMVKRAMDLGVEPRPALAATDPDAAHRRAYYESLIESLGGAGDTSDAAEGSEGDTLDADAYEAVLRDLLERSRDGKDR